MDIHGFCDEKFARVRETFEAHFKAGKEIGASFCATVEGETVVDLWGGFADEEQTTPWQEDTIVSLWSTTKGASSLVVLLLADRGEIDLSKPVADYWPEFAQSGKEAILVRQVLNHTSGVAGFDQPVSMDDMCSHEHMANMIATLAPLWDDRSKTGYHSYTQGYILSEIVRRVRRKSLGVVFAEEIANPLNAEFFIGVPPEVDSRVSLLIPPTGEAKPDINEYVTDKDTLGYRVLSNPGLDIDWVTTEAWRRAEIPSANGHGNARGLANYMRIIALGGTVEGKRILSGQTVELMHKDPVGGIDLVSGAPVNWGLGFMVNPDNPGLVFSGGHGGSVAVANTLKRTTCGYAMNRVVHMEDDRGFNLLASFD